MKIISQNVCLAVLLVLMATSCIVRGEEKGVNQAAQSNSVADHLINNGDTNDAFTPVDPATTPRTRLYDKFLNKHSLAVFLGLLGLSALIVLAVLVYCDIIPPPSFPNLFTNCTEFIARLRRTSATNDYRLAQQS
ncbi:unnamed protein product [Adineta steineri]|uniref:Uncharacterized protein n=1 Tax=Adineta steineri TaxID=433720 RepID=A0A819VG01_9BILA|nr:unnamed protein product [Adineta steineri]CAF4108297.1 unnamed protein product [Adineta steineri]